MPKCVEIEVGDDGTVRVGLEPQEGDAAGYGGQGGGQPQGQPAQAAPGGAPPAPDAGQADDQGGEQAEKAYLQPAGSIDEALQMAKQLLTGGADAGAGQQQSADQQGEQDLAKGFLRGRGSPMPGGM